jgi:hypothetical protein
LKIQYATGERAEDIEFTRFCKQRLSLSTVYKFCIIVPTPVSIVE